MLTGGRLSRGRTRLAPVQAGVLATIALLLFAWPLAREPRLDPTLAFIHVFFAWTLIVGVLWWFSRRLASDKREPPATLR